MTLHRSLLLLSVLSAGCGTTQVGEGRAGDSAPAHPTSYLIRMEDCKVGGPPRFTSDTSALRLIVLGPPKVELVKRGAVAVDGQKYTLYLPKAKSYSTKNTKPSDHSFENTSTLLYVDHDCDGKLTDEEGWFSNLPLRLGDKMFEVAEIAADGSRIVLKPSKAPLRGVILGRVCPPFSFKTADGKQVSRETLAGKPFLLDVWSIT